MAASEAPAARGAPPASGGVVCSQCGQSFPADHVIKLNNQLICAGCKPVYLQRLREGATASTAAFSGQLEYAGFWIRFVAKCIDGIVQSIIVVPIFMLVGIVTGGAAVGFGARPGVQPPVGLIIVMELGSWLLVMGLQIAYEGFFVGRYGATPGKMALSLKVVKPDGSPLTMKHAFGRALGEIVTRFTMCFFMVGYIIAAFDDEKRALHDRICDTRVVRK